MRKKYTEAQIIDKLRLVERLKADGKPVSVVVKEIGVTEQTYYRWKNKYGGMDKPEIQKLRKLERENARLKKLLAESQLDNSILKEVLEGNY